MTDEATCEHYWLLIERLKGWSYRVNTYPPLGLWYCPHCRKVEPFYQPAEVYA